MSSETRRRRRASLAGLLCGLVWLADATSSRPAPAGRALAAPAGDASAGADALPLKPARTVTFTTSEGTWMSLDVSPDGRTILFDLLGDLYRLPIDGGTAERLTSGLPFDAQPRFSPDGSLVAYVSDASGADQLWAMNADGTERRRLSDGSRRLFVSPQWLPDGRFLVVSRAPRLGAYELWLYHRDGSNGIQLTRAADMNVLGAWPSRDGRYLYYSRRQGTAIWNMRLPQWQIARRDLATGGDETLTDMPGSAMRPVVSPDGRWLAYGTRSGAETELRIRDLETGADRRLAGPVDRDDQESASSRDLLPGYAFTPDGRSVVAAYGGHIRRIAIDDGREQLVPFTAEVDLAIGPELDAAMPLAPPQHARLIEDASESPDGKRLVFSSVNRLYLMDLPNGTPRRLTSSTAGEFQPAWSPDGRWIAFVTWDGAEGGLWKVSPEGGAPVRLAARPAYYAQPAFSPRGDTIVFVEAAARARAVHEGGVYQPVGRQLSRVAAGGGEPIRITDGAGLDRPHFARDDDRLYMKDGKALVSMRLDGSDRRTVVEVLVHHEPDPAAPDEIVLSPDGKSVLVANNGTVYRIPIPRIGEPTLVVNVDSPGVPVKKLTSLGGGAVRWADGGATATWSLGSSYFRMPSSSSAPVEIRVPVALAPPRREGTLVLRGGTVVTMRGEEVLSGADVVVAGNRITGVGRTGSIEVPADANVVDVSGKTILPGFVDTHTHMAMATGLNGIRDAQPWPYAANLAYGVTTTRDPQTNTTDVFVYQDLVDLGEIVGPRVLTTGPGVFGGGFFGDVNLKSLEEAREIARRYRDYYRANAIKSYLVGDRKQRQLVVMAGKEIGIRVTTEGAGDAKLDLTHVIDGFSGNEHLVPMFPLYRDVIQLFARTRVAYTPTLVSAGGGPEGANYFFEEPGVEVANDPKVRRFVAPSWLAVHARRRPWFAEEEYVIRTAARGAAEILRAGGRIGVGSHSKLEGLAFHWEMRALEMGGLSPTDVLRAATIGGADICGVAADLGSIEKGKLADMLVFDRDPREDLRNSTALRHVIKDGLLYDPSTLDQIWPVRKTLPPLYWW